MTHAEAEAAIVEAEIEIELQEGQTARMLIEEEEKANSRKTPLYTTDTGERVMVRVDRVGQLLRTRDRTTGKPLYTRNPDQQYQPGVIKCFLHPEHEDREKLDALGLITSRCSKGNIRSLFDLQNHMLNKHSREYKLMKDAEAAEEKAAQMKFYQGASRAR